MHAQSFNQTLTEGLSEQELIPWLGFADPGCKGLGQARIARLRNHFDTLTKAWSASQRELLNVLELPDVVSNFIDYRRTAKPERWLEICLDRGIAIVPSSHFSYPDRLRQISDYPLALFWKGAAPPQFDLHKALAIVGTRTPTIYGQKQTKEFAREIASRTITIVSGMAFGIDTFAHRAALEAGGKTIAVLGCGVDVCYPSSNRPLYQSLLHGGSGAVISEYFPGTQPETWMFPARNRIISGICAGTLIVEAGIKSGALITAKSALDQGREVFAVPGRVDNRMSIGTNKLLQDGAHWVKSWQGILDELGFAYSSNQNKPAVMELYGREKEVCKLLSHDPMRFDDLLEQTGMTAGELSSALAMLELGGIAARVPGDAYVRT